MADKKAIKTDPQAEQERTIRMSMLEQEAKQLEQQLQLMEQKILELQVLEFSLDDLEKSKVKDELFSSLGRNIFIKTSLLSKELLVDVGAKILVKKTIPETKEIIAKDIAKLTESRNGLLKELEKISLEMQKN